MRLNLRGHALSAVLAALYLGLAVFGLGFAWGALRQSSSEVAALREAEKKLAQFVRQADAPTDARIQAARAHKDALMAEYERLRNYCLRHDAMLERDLVNAASNDEWEVKNRYLLLKRDLETRARYATARGTSAKPLLAPYPWETSQKAPAKQELPLVAKKAAIADAIVRLLAADQTTAISEIQIGDRSLPVEPLSTAEGGIKPLRYSIWPVTVEAVASFVQLSRTLHRLAAPADDSPLIVIRSLEWEAQPASRVKLKLRLGVLDFEEGR